MSFVKLNSTANKRSGLLHGTCYFSFRFLLSFCLFHSRKVQFCYIVEIGIYSKTSLAGHLKLVAVYRIHLCMLLGLLYGVSG